MRKFGLITIGVLGVGLLAFYLYGRKPQPSKRLGLLPARGKSSRNREPASANSRRLPAPRKIMPHRDSLEAEARNKQELEKEKEIFARYPELRVDWVRAKRRVRILQSRAQNANRQPPPSLDVEVWLRETRERQRVNAQRRFVNPKDLPPGAFPYPDR